MKTLPSLILAIAGLSILPATASLRTFTNTEGKTLEAELVKADKSTATLRIKGGRLATVKLATLSENDRLFIQKWLSDKVPDLTITPDFDRGNSKDRVPGSSQPTGTNTQTFGFSLKIKNYSPDKTLEPTEVVYYIVGKSLQNDTYKILSRQSQEVTIGPGETKSLRFKTIKNKYSDSPREWNKNKEGYRGLGYVLQVQRLRDMRLIYLESPTKTLSNSKEQIVALVEGDITKGDFIKPPKKPKELVVEEVSKPEVITIK